MRASTGSIRRRSTGTAVLKRWSGSAIKGRRDEVIVATKCGRVWEGASREIGKCLRRASVFAEVDASLRRLQIERIDLYQVHWPEPDEEIEEGWAAVADLVKAGKVRFAGVCNFSLAQLQRAQPIHPIASLQPPYSMLRREIEAEIVPWCEANQVGILAVQPDAGRVAHGRVHGRSRGRPG